MGSGSSVVNWATDQISNPRARPLTLNCSVVYRLNSNYFSVLKNSQKRGNVKAMGNAYGI